MEVAKLLMYGLTDEDGYIGVVLSGQIYELEYSQSLFDNIKAVLSLKTLGFN